MTTRTTIGNTPMTGLGPGLAPGTGAGTGPGLASGSGLAPGTGSGPGSGLAPGAGLGSGLGLETRARDIRVGDIGKIDRRIGLVAADAEWGRSHEGDDPHPSVTLHPVVSLKHPVIIDFPVRLDRGLVILDGDDDDSGGGGGEDDADGGWGHGDNNANDDDVPLGHAQAIDLHQSQSPAVNLATLLPPHVPSTWIDQGQELGQGQSSESSGDSKLPTQILMMSSQSPGIIDIPAWKDHLLRSLE